jgi:hypothetical protein
MQAPWRCTPQQASCLEKNLALWTHLLELIVMVHGGTAPQIINKAVLMGTYPVLTVVMYSMSTSGGTGCAALCCLHAHAASHVANYHWVVQIAVIPTGDIVSHTAAFSITL